MKWFTQESTLTNSDIDHFSRGASLVSTAAKDHMIQKAEESFAEADSFRLAWSTFFCKIRHCKELTLIKLKDL